MFRSQDYNARSRVSGKTDELALLYVFFLQHWSLMEVGFCLRVELIGPDWSECKIRNFPRPPAMMADKPKRTTVSVGSKGEHNEQTMWPNKLFYVVRDWLGNVTGDWCMWQISIVNGRVLGGIWWSLQGQLWRHIEYPKTQLVGIPFRFPIKYLSEWNRSILPHHNPQIASKKHLVWIFRAHAIFQLQIYCTVCIYTL